MWNPHALLIKDSCFSIWSPLPPRCLPSSRGSFSVYLQVSGTKSYKITIQNIPKLRRPYMAAKTIDSPSTNIPSNWRQELPNLHLILGQNHRSPQAKRDLSPAKCTHKTQQSPVSDPELSCNPQPEQRVLLRAPAMQPCGAKVVGFLSHLATANSTSHHMALLQQSDRKAVFGKAQGCRGTKQGWIPATWGFDHQEHPKTIGFNGGFKFSRKWCGDQSSFWQKWTGLQSILSSFSHWSFNGSNPSDNKLFRSCQSYSQKPHCYWFPAYSKLFALGEWKPPQQKVWLETDSPISKFFLLESLKGSDIEDGNIYRAYPL